MNPERLRQVKAVYHSALACEPDQRQTFLNQACAGDESLLKEVQSLSGQGRIIGTVAYMSPEQAEGKPVDARSDIFSFGSVRYEMLNGQRAFQGDSNVSTLSAILRGEPLPLSGAIPHDLGKIITRCLRKDPKRRFQTMADLKVALEELKEDSDSGKLISAATEAAAARRRFPLWVPAVAALLILAAAAAFFYVLRYLKPEAPQFNVVPLTSYPGIQRTPSLSPDGREVAFTWNGEKQDNDDIYVQMLSGGAPQRRTSDPAPDLGPQWSPDGNQIAFFRMGYVYLISPRGGAERKLCQAGDSRTAWSPDGKSLAGMGQISGTDPWFIYLFSVETGGYRRLTTPPSGFNRDFQPAFSPDGKNLVFVRMPTQLGNDAYILPLANGAPQGEPWRLTNDSTGILGLAWTPDSRQIVFSSARGGRRSLWQVPAVPGAAPKRIPGTDDGSYPTISKVPPIRLAFIREYSDINIWRLGISASEKNANPPTQIIASREYDSSPQFSPDGRRIAFSSRRSESPEIYVSDSDGSNPIQLTSMAGKRTAGAPTWSPDGRQIVFDSMAAGSLDIFAINVESRVLRQVTDDHSFNARPSWSRDGRWIYFGSNKSGTEQVWKVQAEGGNSRQITKSGGFEAVGAPDGKILYYTKKYVGGEGVWCVPVEGGEEVPAIDSARSGHWAVTDKGICYIDFAGIPPTAPKPLKFFSFDTRRVSDAGTIGTWGRTQCS